MQHNDRNDIIPCGNTFQSAAPGRTTDVRCLDKNDIN